MINDMFEDITQLIGEKEGPISIVLAGVHGNEKGGIEALEKIILNLKIESGRVLFGYGNPLAIKKNSRFTEANLNRMFKDDSLLSKEEKTSYEYGRAQFLKKYLKGCGALLDVHASLTPNSEPFVICEENAKEIVKYLPVNRVVSGFDLVEPGGTDYYMNSIGKIGICAECGYIEDSQSARVAEDVILAFIKARGHITNDISPQKQSHVRVYDIYITKTNNFTLSKPFGDFDEISAGQIIGTDGDKEILAGRDSIIVFARDREQIGSEAFLIGEKKNSPA